ncbi:MULTISPECIES: hypothetical protein [Yersinia pseudotuberculosis complex]|uniref:hypothetical protein n=1 Tax=Yersinia pseudotuberculosis complex TaxID=1649845 RepID=UPI0005702688|nr:MULTISPECIES: hypothetical protein [Yersinia pseudotuberculosis complex]MBO1555206.1 hypothetical protein [Yersinia pseudotuberculosis]MBO1563352.1 hypothetical protein [Yersinia pseudotuberculosis]MCE4111544.1 hypothetical protein [Yersinia pseudotuberculosis]MCF1161644.1 hypothetical protein [Yersinia pseudotuberculosis]RYC28543.1 hypothetical protein EU971_00630 [Yersinia pseudotuberculosis]
MNNSSARLRINLYLRYNPTNYLNITDHALIREFSPLILLRRTDRMHTLAMPSPKLSDTILPSNGST